MTTYTDLTEAAAAAALYTKDTMVALQECLQSNVAVLLSQGRTVAAANIKLGTHEAAPEYPIIFIAHHRTVDGDTEIAAVRHLVQRFRIYCYDNASGGGDWQGIEQGVAGLADRVKEVLHNNRDLQADTLWYDLMCTEVITGQLHGQRFTWGAQIDVVVRTAVD